MFLLRVPRGKPSGKPLGHFLDVFFCSRAPGCCQGISAKPFGKSNGKLFGNLFIFCFIIFGGGSQTMTPSWKFRAFSRKVGDPFWLNVNPGFINPWLINKVCALLLGIHRVLLRSWVNIRLFAPADFFFLKHCAAAGLLEQQAPETLDESCSRLCRFGVQALSSICLRCFCLKQLPCWFLRESITAGSLYIHICIYIYISILLFSGDVCANGSRSSKVDIALFRAPLPKDPLSRPRELFHIPLVGSS